MATAVTVATAGTAAAVRLTGMLGQPARVVLAEPPVMAARAAMAESAVIPVKREVSCRSLPALLFRLSPAADLLVRITSLRT